MIGKGRLRADHPDITPIEHRDWLILETDFVTTSITINALSWKYMIPYNDVKKECSRRGWERMRWEYKDRMSDAMVKHRIEAEKNRMDQIIRIQDKAIGLVEKYFNDEMYFLFPAKQKVYNALGRVIDEFYVATKLDGVNTKAVAEIIQALDKLQRGQRLSLGVIDGMDMEKLIIEKQRLDIEKQKLELLKQRMAAERPNEGSDDGLVDALNAAVGGVWGDGEVSDGEVSDGEEQDG